MARADKAAAVAELTTAFRDSQAAVLTEYRGLSVAELSQLRTALGANATYSVVKNTLTKIAAREAGLEDLDDLLVGPSAIAFVQGDPVEAAKGLRDFARTHPLLIIKGGVLDGATITPAELTRLADLESREVLLAKLAGAMKASLSQAAALFQAPLAQAVRTVEALRAKVEADPSLAGSAVSDVDAASAAEDTAGAAEGSTPDAAEGTADVSSSDSTGDTPPETVDATAADAGAGTDAAQDTATGGADDTTTGDVTA
jgi:large subunit ribosomal protein L10